MEEIMVITNEFNEETALEAAAYKASIIYQNLYEECEEYSTEDIENCVYEKLSINKIRVILTNNDFTKKKRYIFDIYTTLNEAQLRGLI